MQLTSFTDYALRILMYAAAQPARRCLTTDVAAAFGISRHHTVKIVNELQHLGYVETVRGRNGGFALARDAATINIADVVRRTEADMALVECFDRETNTCPLAVHRELATRTPLGTPEFARWLALFHQSVDTLFRGPRADDAKVRASRIAAVMQHHILADRESAAAV